MRNAIRARVSGSRTTVSHVGLGYTTLAPVSVDGKVSVEAKGAGTHQAGWLAALADTPTSTDYSDYVAAWLASFTGVPARMFALTFSTRLLIGHGTSSGTDVGLTMHHAWGTPLVPGSALKGIVAHHVASSYGVDHAPWRGVGWERTAIARGPGEIYRGLFGAPDAEDDRTVGAPGATRGLVTFHDALYRGIAPPPSGARNGRSPPPDPRTPPFAADVLTVHQKDYYNSSGDHEPSDHDSPNPVAFLSVRPYAQFTVMLEGPPDWTRLAGHLLSEALESTSVGGKGTGGYGRATLSEDRLPPPPPSELVTAFAAWLAKAPGTQSEVLTSIDQQWLARLLAAPSSDRAAAAKLIRRKINNSKLAALRDAQCARLEAP